jgi:hypothetical protein
LLFEKCHGLKLVKAGTFFFFTLHPSWWLPTLAAPAELRSSSPAHNHVLTIPQYVSFVLLVLFGRYLHSVSIKALDPVSLLCRKVSMSHHFASLFMRSPSSPAFLTVPGFFSMRAQQRLGTISFPTLTRHASPVASKRLPRALPSSNRRTPYIIPPAGTRRHPQGDRICSWVTVLRFLIASLMFHLTTGICSWQLMERHPKLHPTVWILGALEEGYERW